MTTKEYRIGVCKTTDILSGEDFMPPYYKVYLVEEWDNQPPTTWYETEFDTLEEARKYIEEKKMDVVVDKYKKLIEDELFKATPDETTGFCNGLKAYLDEIIGQANYEKEQYK